MPGNPAAPGRQRCCASVGRRAFLCPRPVGRAEGCAAPPAPEPSITVMSADDTSGVATVRRVEEGSSTRPPALRGVVTVLGA
eukprot:scaffold246844_cov26-Tisochrysis_lutea.AAC.1